MVLYSFNGKRRFVPVYVCICIKKIQKGREKVTAVVKLREKN